MVFLFPFCEERGGKRHAQDGGGPGQRMGGEFGFMFAEAQGPLSAGSVPPFSPHCTNKGSISSDNAACVRSERSGTVRGDLLCVTDVNPKPYRSCYICFGFVRSTEGRGVHSMVKGQTTCHISLPSLATTEGCFQRKGWH